MKRGALSLAALLALGVACDDRSLPPAGQFLVHIQTDAPLVSMSERRFDPTNIGGLFDRLRVEVIAGDGSLACDTCRRDFTITTKNLDEGLTFGVKLPPRTAGYRLRARLFPGDGLIGDRPRSDVTIDGVFALPAHGADGVVEVTAQLLLEAVGVPADLESEAAAIIGGVPAPPPPAIPRARGTCAGAPSESDVCVPSGIYWTNRAFTAFEIPEDPRRAIVMSAFYLDKREVTVADLRASKLVKPADPQRGGACTYTDAAGANEALPVTCLTVQLAQAYCQARGGDLPTLAQMEYVRSRLEGEPYVWGVDVAACEDAVWGRTSACAMLGPGPQPAGSTKRDRLTLPNGSIEDLAGNVGEWLVDRAVRDCRVAGLYFDPLCGKKGENIGGATIGSYADYRETLVAGARVALPGSLTKASPGDTLGFRCARPGG